jgi:hypothetical protein
MFISIDINLCATHNLRRNNIPNVARLAEIVPSDDLDGIREDVEDLEPAVVPEGFAGRVPVLAPFSEVLHFVNGGLVVGEEGDTY